MLKTMVGKVFTYESKTGYFVINLDIMDALRVIPRTLIWLKGDDIQIVQVSFPLNLYLFRQ